MKPSCQTVLISCHTAPSFAKAMWLDSRVARPRRGRVQLLEEKYVVKEKIAKAGLPVVYVSTGMFMEWAFSENLFDWETGKVYLLRVYLGRSPAFCSEQPCCKHTFAEFTKGHRRHSAFMCVSRRLRQARFAPSVLTQHMNTSSLLCASSSCLAAAMNRQVTIYGSGTKKLPLTSVHDIAAWLPDVLLTPKAAEETVLVGNVVSWNEVVDAYNEVAGVLSRRQTRTRDRSAKDRSQSARHQIGLDLGLRSGESSAPGLHVRFSATVIRVTSTLRSPSSTPSESLCVLKCF